MNDLFLKATHLLLVLLLSIFLSLWFACFVLGGEGISHKDFHALLNTVPFIASVKGGGLDPSPKAWEAILAGTIPIIDVSSPSLLCFTFVSQRLHSAP